MKKFTIEEEGHADYLGEFNTFEEALFELEKISKIPWGTKPNVSPCSTPYCSRDYTINEFDVSKKQWKLIKNNFVLSVDPDGSVWGEGFERE